MTATTYEALGFNPAPGTLGNVEHAANRLQHVASEMGKAHDTLVQIGRNDGIWAGSAAQAFRGTVEDLPKYLDTAHRSLGEASHTLQQWSHDLSSMQHTATDYEHQATEALKRLQHARNNPDLQLAGQHFEDDASLHAANQKLQTAQDDLNRAEGELSAIRDRAKRLLEQHDDLAKQVENALKKAADDAPDAPGLLERLGDALSKLGKEISDTASKVWDWCQDHAEDIAKVGDILSTVGTVLSIVAAATSWIPGVDVVTAAAAAGVSGAAMAAHGLAKAAGADVKWSDMGFDALGVIPGAGAAKGGKAAIKVLPKVAKQAGTAAKGAESGKAAAGAKAAASAFRHEGASSIGQHAHYVNKAIEGANKVTGKNIPQLSVDSVDTGGKTILRNPKIEYTAGSHAAVGAGSAAYAAHTAGQTIAEPYTSQARDDALNGFRNALSGR